MYFSVNTSYKKYMSFINKNSLLYKELRGAYVQKHDEYSTDLNGLYLNLERVFDKHLKQGTAKDGDEFLLDIGAGISLRFQFFTDSTAIYLMNFKDGLYDERLLVRNGRSEMLAKQESEAIRGFQLALDALHLPIGKTYPPEFKKMLSDIQPGTIISFTEGRSYVCKNNSGQEITFYQVFDGNLENLNIKNFSKRLPITVNLSSDTSLQYFYQKNCKLLTQSLETEYCLPKVYSAQVKQIEDSVSRLHSEKVTIGQDSFVVKKSWLKDDVYWYDNQGIRRNSEDIAFLLGILNTQPIRTKYKRVEPTFLKSTEDEAFRLSIEKVLDTGDYAHAYTQLKNYSQKNKEDLTIQVDGILRTNNTSFSYGSIVFKNGVAYKVSYLDHKFKDVDKMLPLSSAEFETLCKAKYTETYNRIYATTIEMVEEQYHIKEENLSETQKKIIENTVQKKLDVQSGKVFAKEDMSVGKQEFTDLLENLSENSISSQLLR